MTPQQGSGGVKSWARTQFFRAWTAAATLVLLGLCFFYYPEWLQWYLRAATRGIENAADLLPSPWAARTEVVLRTVGASFWFQIALAILAVRVVAWAIAAALRAAFGRRGGPPAADVSERREPELVSPPEPRPGAGA
jgi:hypothetical protein